MEFLQQWPVQPKKSEIAIALGKQYAFISVKFEGIIPYLHHRLFWDRTTSFRCCATTSALQTKEVVSIRFAGVYTVTVNPSANAPRLRWGLTVNVGWGRGRAVPLPLFGDQRRLHRGYHLYRESAVGRYISGDSSQTIIPLVDVSQTVHFCSCQISVRFEPERRVRVFSNNHGCKQFCC